MVQESVACPACREPVSRGRLSCPQCGAVLAAVAGRMVAERQPSRPVWATPASMMPSLAMTDDLGPTARTETFASVEPDPPADHEPVRPAPAPGAWLPPAFAASPATDFATPPPVAFQARAWGRSPESDATLPGPAATATGSAGTGRSIPAFDAARLDEAAGLIVLAGAMATVVGFLVPWSQFVIGARNSGGYTDTWGLAGPGHPAVFLAALAVLALAAVPNPVRPWFRTGILGLLLGPLVLGLIWPYLFGPLGAGPGVMLLVVAVLLLVTGGLMTAIVHRHASAPPPV